MRKIVCSFVVFVLLVCSSCVQTLPTNAQGNSSLGHVSYFGFVGVDCGLSDPHNPRENKNYIDEVAGFTNIAHLCVYDLEQAEDLSNRLGKFSENNVKALLDIQPIFFEYGDEKSPSGEKKLILRKDYKKRWDKFVERSDIKKHQSNVAAISLADEPFWNGLELQDFTKAIQTVKKDLPNVNVIMVEAYPMVATMKVPSEVDWVGFDRYGVGDVTTDADYQKDFKMLKSKLSRDGQKIVLIMETQWLPIYGNLGCPPKAMSVVAENYAKLASNEKDFVAIIGYLWVGGMDSTEQLGARNLPSSVLETYRNIGQKVIKLPSNK